MSRLFQSNSITDLEIAFSAYRMAILAKDEHSTGTLILDKIQKELLPIYPTYLKNQILSRSVTNQSLLYAEEALKAGANPDTFNFDHKVPKTMLHVAASYAGNEMMELLLKYGASPYISICPPEAKLFFEPHPLTLMDTLAYYKEKAANMPNCEEIISEFKACEKILIDFDFSKSKCPFNQITIDQIDHNKYETGLSFYFYRDENKIEDEKNINELSNDIQNIQLASKSKP